VADKVHGFSPHCWGNCTLASPDNYRVIIGCSRDDADNIFFLTHSVSGIDNIKVVVTGLKKKRNTTRKKTRAQFGKVLVDVIF